MPPVEGKGQYPEEVQKKASSMNDDISEISEEEYDNLVDAGPKKPLKKLEEFFSNLSKKKKPGEQVKQEEITSSDSQDDESTAHPVEGASDGKDGGVFDEIDVPNDTIPPADEVPAESEEVASKKEEGIVHEEAPAEVNPVENFDVTDKELPPETETPLINPISSTRVSSKGGIVSREPVQQPEPAKLVDKKEVISKPMAPSKPSANHSPTVPTENPAASATKIDKKEAPVVYTSLYDIVQKAPTFQTLRSRLNTTNPAVVESLCNFIQKRALVYMNTAMSSYSSFISSNEKISTSNTIMHYIAHRLTDPLHMNDLNRVAAHCQSLQPDVLERTLWIELGKVPSFPIQLINKLIATKKQELTKIAFEKSQSKVISAVQEKKTQSPLPHPVAPIEEKIPPIVELTPLVPITKDDKSQSINTNTKQGRVESSDPVAVKISENKAVEKQTLAKEKSFSTTIVNVGFDKQPTYNSLPGFDKYFLVDKSKPYPKVIGIEYMTPQLKTGSLEEKKLAQEKQNQEVTQRKKEALRYLTYKGLSPVAAVGVLANIVHESSLLNVGAIGDRGKSHGLCQWRDNRRINMERFVSQVGSSGDWKDFYGQLDYILEELNGKYSTAMKGLQKATTPYQAAHAFCVHFEAPTDTQTQAANRGDSAMGVYSTLAKNLASQEEIHGSKEKMAQFAKNDITVHGDSGAVLLANYQGGYKNKLSRENEGKSSKRILDHMPQSLGKATIVLAGRNDMHPGGQETRENIKQIAQYVAEHGSTPILPLLPEPKLTPIKGFAGPDDRYKERESYRQYMLSLNGAPIGNTGKRMIVVDCGNVEIASYDNLHPVPKSLDAIITQAIFHPIV